MPRTRIKFKNGYGGFAYGYAIITDGEYMWCFTDKSDKYGFVIHRKDIVKIYD